ncbi:MAG: aminoacyl-tRNA hydrolase [Patescibacteria group bacterium]
MKLIVGLGNPGRKYKKTRHNVGFRIIDEIIKSQKSRQFGGQAPVKSQNLIFLKPNTFMNRSGKAVKSLTTKYKIPTTDIIVVHDDVDLPFGTIRISKNSSSAGHKGVQSIIDELGTQNFTRIRIGIKQVTGSKKQETEKFVLEKFTKQEEKQLSEIIKKAVEQIKLLFDSCS